jgi:hypothetical protein
VEHDGGFGQASQDYVMSMRRGLQILNLECLSPGLLNLGNFRINSSSSGKAFLVYSVGMNEPQRSSPSFGMSTPQKNRPKSLFLSKILFAISRVRGMSSKLSSAISRSNEDTDCKEARRRIEKGLQCLAYSWLKET